MLTYFFSITDFFGRQQRITTWTNDKWQQISLTVAIKVPRNVTDGGEVARNVTNGGEVARNVTDGDEVPINL